MDYRNKRTFSESIILYAALALIALALYVAISGCYTYKHFDNEPIGPYHLKDPLT